MKTRLFALLALAALAAMGLAHLKKTRTPGDGLAPNHAVSAAFEDGAYLGRLAARSRQPPHVASARWALPSDREMFAAAYDWAYQTSWAEAEAKPLESMGAPFRDGLYLGELDAKNGNGQHMASGRWAVENDRASFIRGYEQAYTGLAPAGMAENRQSAFAGKRSR